MAKYTASEIAEARETLTALFPKGATVYTIVRSVAKSGMSRKISCLAISRARQVGQSYASDTEIETRDVSALVAKVLGRAIDRNVLAIVTHGCGMDMCFETVYALAQALHSDGYSLKKEVL